MPCDHCPIGDGCRSYPTLCDNVAKNPAKWLSVLDRVNSPPDPTDPPSKYPPLATQAANAIGAAARFVGSGFAMVDQAEFNRQHATCEACEHFDAAWDRCRKCACYLAVKPWSKAEKCPVGKWAESTK